MKGVLIKNARLINEGSVEKKDVLVEGAFIKEISERIESIPPNTMILSTSIGSSIPSFIVIF